MVIIYKPEVGFVTGFPSFLIAVHCAHRKTQTYHHGLCDPCVVVGGISYHPVSFSCTNFLLEQAKLMLICGALMNFFLI